MLMDNHYNWLLHTPKPNLVAGMSHTQRYNAKHRIEDEAAGALGAGEEGGAERGGGAEDLVGELEAIVSSLSTRSAAPKGRALALPICAIGSPRAR